MQSHERPPELGRARELAIEATHVGVTYSNGTEAARDVTLRIPKGEFFGFLGPNGAGKTTTIKMLTTLLRPTTGDITVNGFDTREDPRPVRESIGYMAQETSIDPALAVGENLRFACRAYDVPSTERDGRIDNLVDLVDLASKEDDRAQTLSGGQKKRLDAAMSLVHQPPILFLDEPTTGLDPSARNRLWEYFRTINRQGTTVFLTTQYLEEADALCSDLAVILDGKLVASGSPAELKAKIGGDVLEIAFDDSDESAVDRARTVVTDSAVVTDDETESIQPTDDGLCVTSTRARRIGPELVVKLTEAGFTITGFNVRSPTLDDVFLTLTDGSTTGVKGGGVRSNEQNVEARE